MKRHNGEISSTNLIIYPNNPDSPYDEKWTIKLKKEDTEIGWVSFEGEKAAGTIPISIELENLYRNQGFGTEALRIITDWAFLHKNIYEVTTSTDHENDSYIFALEKAGYIYRRVEDGKEIYSIQKPKSSWLGLYICIGIVIGLIFAVIFPNPFAAFIIGLVPCILAGTKMDLDSKHDKEKVLGHKDTRHGIKKSNKK